MCSTSRSTTSTPRNPVDPALVEAIAQALAARAAPAVAPTAPPPKPSRPEVLVCFRCQIGAEKPQARACGWKRTPQGWECPDHTPIDYPFVADLAGEAADKLESAREKFCHKDPTALDDLDEALGLLEDLAPAVQALRDQLAAAMA